MTQTKTLFHKKLTGFGQDSRLISYVTFWSQDWKISAPMLFYPKEPDNVVDIFYDSNKLLTVITYPHNDENLCKLRSEQFSEQLAQMGEDMKHTSQNFTVILTENGPEYMTLDRFTDHYPTSGIRNKLFVFDHDSFGFPVIYCVAEVQQKPPHQSLLSVLAKSSHLASVPATKQTIFGKKIFYILAQSFSLRKFEPEVPAVDAISFPTSARYAPNSFLKTKNLEALLEKAEVDKFKVKNGKIVQEKGTEESESVSTAIVPAGNYSSSFDMKIDDKIVASIVEKGSVNLSDLFTYGLADALKMIGNSDMILQVIPDLPSLVRKMCIFQGKFHCVPIAPNDDLLDFLDIEEDLLVLDTADSFPSKTL